MNINKSFFRRWYRAYIARMKPYQFMQWLNAERIHVQVNNDPSGRWHVRIGIYEPVTALSLGEAMCVAYWERELNSEWRWTTDWLHELENKKPVNNSNS